MGSCKFTRELDHENPNGGSSDFSFRLTKPEAIGSGDVKEGLFANDVKEEIG